MCQVFNATSYIIIPADLSGRAILYFNNAGRLQIWQDKKKICLNTTFKCHLTESGPFKCNYYNQNWNFKFA